MSGKQTKVELVVPSHNIKREFGIEHAERLLRMPNNGGWQLPEGSQYELTENGIRFKRNKETRTGAKEESSDK